MSLIAIYANKKDYANGRVIAGHVNENVFLDNRVLLFRKCAVNRAVAQILSHIYHRHRKNDIFR